MLKRLMMIILWTSCAAAIAQERQVHGLGNFGDWSVAVSSDQTLLFAATGNANTVEQLGKYCTSPSKPCRWLLMSSARCIKGTSTSALLSSPIGVVAYRLTCDAAFQDAEKGIYVYIFEDSEGMDAFARRSSDYIGIAFPIANGLFQTYRFSLFGANAALNALALAKGAFNSTPNQSNDGQSR